jgi:hypothetical protein
MTAQFCVYSNLFDIVCNYCSMPTITSKLLCLLVFVSVVKCVIVALEKDNMRCFFCEVESEQVQLLSTLRFSRCHSSFERVSPLAKLN